MSKSPKCIAKSFPRYRDGFAGRPSAGRLRRGPPPRLLLPGRDPTCSRWAKKRTNAGRTSSSHTPRASARRELLLRNKRSGTLTRAATKAIRQPARARPSSERQLGGRPRPRWRNLPPPQKASAPRSTSSWGSATNPKAPSFPPPAAGGRARVGASLLELRARQPAPDRALGRALRRVFVFSFGRDMLFFFVFHFKTMKSQ